MIEICTELDTNGKGKGFMCSKVGMESLVEQQKNATNTGIHTYTHDGMPSTLHLWIFNSLGFNMAIFVFSLDVSMNVHLRLRLICVLPNIAVLIVCKKSGNSAENIVCRSDLMIFTVEAINPIKSVATCIYCRRSFKSHVMHIGCE